MASNSSCAYAISIQLRCRACEEEGACVKLSILCARKFPVVYSTRQESFLKFARLFMVRVATKIM